MKRTTHDKVIKCHHCKKQYSVSYIKGRIIFLLIECVILILINVFILKQTTGMTIPFLAIGTAIIILASTLLFPFTVRYKKIAGEEKKPQKYKKAQRKHKESGKPL